MKWHDEKSATLEDWTLLEKLHNFLKNPVRWVTFCPNPDCGKIWKEGEFEDDIINPKVMLTKEEIRKQGLNEWGVITFGLKMQLSYIQLN